MDRPDQPSPGNDRPVVRFDAVLILLIILVVLFFGFGGVGYGYRDRWGSYYGGGLGVLGTLFVILLILLLLGVVR